MENLKMIDILAIGGIIIISIGIFWAVYAITNAILIWATKPVTKKIKIHPQMTDEEYMEIIESLSKIKSS